MRQVEKAKMVIQVQPAEYISVLTAIFTNRTDLSLADSIEAADEIFAISHVSADALSERLTREHGEDRLRLMQDLKEEDRAAAAALGVPSSNSRLTVAKRVIPGM